MSTLDDDLAAVEDALRLAASRAANISTTYLIYRTEVKRVLVDPIDALIEDCRNLQGEVWSL